MVLMQIWVPSDVCFIERVLIKVNIGDHFVRLEKGVWEFSSYFT